MRTKIRARINFILWNTRECGGNRVVLEYASRLVKDNYEVKIFSVIGGNTDWYSPVIKVYPIWNMAFQKDSEVLIATFWPTVYLAFLFPTKSKFYFIQGWEIGFYRNPLLRFLVSKSYQFPFQKITISSFLKNKLQKDILEKIEVVPNGIDGSIFTKPSKKVYRDKLKIVSVVSRYEYTKGIDQLVVVINNLKKIYKKVIFTLVSFEKYSYSDTFDNFRSNITLHELVDVYRQSDILLATPKVEGFFLPALEAMSQGCIVISTDCGGINDFAENGVNCFIVKNPEEIIKSKIINKIVDDDDLRKRLIAKSIQTAKEFSIEKSFIKFETIITKNIC